MKITKSQLKQIIKEELLKLQEYKGTSYDLTHTGDFERGYGPEDGSGRKFEIIKPITVELPGDVRDYQPGDIVTLQGCDKETRDGIGICWGHGGYALIPVGYYREL